jgi:pentapeptide repeat protein
MIRRGFRGWHERGYPAALRRAARHADRHLHPCGFISRGAPRRVGADHPGSGRITAPPETGGVAGSGHGRVQAATATRGDAAERKVASVRWHPLPPASLGRHFRQHGQRASGDPTFVFTHKSFGEYLTARRVIRAAERVVRETEKRLASPDEGWDEKDALRYWVQVCGPSPVSPYLHSFLLNEVAIREGDEVGRWQHQLTGLFSHVLRHGLPMEQLQLGTFRESMFRARNAEEALLVVLNACARRTGKVSPVEHVDPTAFGAWFKRIQGQRTGSESSLAARCLSFMNLAGAYLDIADLYGANLESSDLSGVAAHIACLERANLRNANLSGARCWEANLSNAFLGHANLT